MVRQSPSNLLLSYSPSLYCLSSSLPWLPIPTPSLPSAYIAKIRVPARPCRSPATMILFSTRSSISSSVVHPLSARRCHSRTWSVARHLSMRHRLCVSICPTHVLGRMRSAQTSHFHLHSLAVLSGSPFLSISVARACVDV
jgi:hypothetical protein